MRVALAFLLLSHLALAADSRQVAPESDSRLAKLSGEQSQQIAVNGVTLTYYANKGGGYTFLNADQILFYSLPYSPTTYKFEHVVASPFGLRSITLENGRSNYWVG